MSSHLQIYVEVAQQVTWSLLAPLWNILPCSLFCWILMRNVWFLSLMKKNPHPNPLMRLSCLLSSWGFFWFFFLWNLPLCRIFGGIFSIPQLCLAGDCADWKYQCLDVLLILILLFLLSTSEQGWRYRANSLTSVTCVNLIFKLAVFVINAFKISES